MGLINCDVHGETGFMPFVSKELSDKISKGKRFKKSDLVQIDVTLIDEEDDEEMYTMQYILTKECSLEMGIKTKYEIRSEEDERDFDAVFDPVMRGGGICGQCFKNSIID